MALQMTQSKNPAAGGPQVTTSSINGEETPLSTPPVFPDSAWRGVLAPYYNLVFQTTEAADSFIWGSAMAMLSVLFSGGVAMPWGAQLMRPVLFLCLLGVTGRTRKSTAIQDARQLLLEPLLPRPSFPGEPEPITVVSGFGSGEGMADALADRDYWPPGKKKGEDPPEKMIGRRALFEIDEFGAQLAKANKDAAGNFIGIMLRMWDCPASLSLRTRREQMNATGPLGTVIAASTYSHMGSTLNADLVHHGLLNRFILLHGEPGAPLPMRPPIDLQEHTALLAELQQAISSVWGKPFTVSAEAVAVNAFHYNQDYARPRESELMEAATSRTSATAMRLALLFAAIRGATEIDAGDMQAAWDVMRYNHAVVTSLVQRLEASTWRDVEQRVLARARRVGERYAGTFSKDEVRAGLKGGNGLDARTFSMAWDGLLRAGDIIPVAQGSDRYRIHEGGQS
jgi:hypothetical protein